MNGLLASALGVDGGIVCAVGAGGKKSLLYALAAEARGRVALTATAHTAPFPTRLGARQIIDEPQVLQRRVPREAQAGLTAFACPSNKAGRLAGVDPETLASILSQSKFDLSLVKADGARRRGIKAPRSDEPLIVPGSRRVLALLSANVIGAPLCPEHVHRPELLGPLVGAQPGEPLSLEHLLRLITAPSGSLQRIGDAALTVVINQVDDPALLPALDAMARRALATTAVIDRIVLTCLNGSPRVLACITRDQLV